MTYWNDDGKYQKAYSNLWEKLVPARGEAETVRGELLRAASKLYYDLFNNGLGNLDVLHRHWRYVRDRKDLLIDLGISARDFHRVDLTFAMWWKGYQGDAEWVDYDELVRQGLPELFERLVDATVIYAALKEAGR